MAMPGLILHHYPRPPFAGKVRLALGLKGVTVTPDDAGRDPVAGRLLQATGHEITMHRSHPALDALNLHAPRAGFDARPA